MGHLMNGWNEGITNAVAYMEENLTEKLDIKEIADRAYVSSFYFKKYSVLYVDLPWASISGTDV